MSLKLRITEDMKAAMRARETGHLAALRLLIAAIRQREIDERIDIDDAGVISIIEKLGKQRKDAQSQYEAAGRQDLADQEAFEFTVLSAYMPRQLTADEMVAAVTTAISECGATSARDMGKVMGLLKLRLSGRADMTAVSNAVKAALA